LEYAAKCTECEILLSEFPTPFDEFEHSAGRGSAGRRRVLALWLQAGLRGLTSVSLWVAILTASFIILRHALQLITGLPLLISLKSGIPLIAIGISYFVLILTLRRAPGQRLVGILIGLAFVLWGSEQFLREKSLISYIDDVVVFLFVIDLSIVIRQNLQSEAGERQLRKACFPVVKTIESFNFSAQPSIDQELVRTLLEGKYIERRENIIIIGKSGTGKTHLAAAFGYAACLQRKRVRFITASNLVAELIENHESRRLSRFYRRLFRLDLLIVDEMGYGRFSEFGEQMLFELLRSAYERMSLVITTTMPLQKWGETFESEQVARAAADRLTDRGHLLEATGDSYWKPGRNAVVSPKFRTF
jgi:DNA replication protein DnaC